MWIAFKKLWNSSRVEKSYPWNASKIFEKTFYRGKFMTLIPTLAYQIITCNLFRTYFRGVWPCKASMIRLFSKNDSPVIFTKKLIIDAQRVFNNPRWMYQFLRISAHLRSAQQAAIYLIKDNNGNTRTMCQICSKLSVNTQE